MVYSAGEGQSAMDRLSEADADPNSVFTRAFLPLLRADLPLLDAIKISQERVYALARSADHDQTPAYYDEVRGRACLSRECKEPNAASASSASDEAVAAIIDAQTSPDISRRDDRQASRRAVEGTGEKEVGGASESQVANLSAPPPRQAPDGPLRRERAEAGARGADASSDAGGADDAAAIIDAGQPRNALADRRGFRRGALKERANKKLAALQEVAVCECTRAAPSSRADRVRRRRRGDHRRGDEPRDSRVADRRASRGAVEGAGEKEVGGASRKSQSVNLSPAPDLHAVEEADRELANECDRVAASPDDERRPAGIVGVPLDRIDPAKAVPACRAAATANPSEARITYEIARALSRTNGADAEMVSYYERAAEAGYPSAMSSLGVLFEIGRGVAKDPVKAVAWYRKAAEAGSAVGMINWHHVCERKRRAGGLRPSHGLVHQGRRRGNALGMTQVGTLYHRGEGVRLDYAQAAAWHHKAAEAGDPLGMYYCGLELLHGEGVPQNLTKARNWFRKAAEAGNGNAKEELKKLGPSPPAMKTLPTISRIASVDRGRSTTCHLPATLNSCCQLG